MSDGWAPLDPRWALDDRPEGAPHRAMLEDAYALELELRADPPAVRGLIPEDISSAEWDGMSDGSRRVALRSAFERTGRRELLEECIASLELELAAQGRTLRRAS